MARLRELALVHRRLLWRVSRKLTLSYLFIGAVPAALIVMFFLLAGLLLLSYVGSHLVQVELGQLQERAALAARAAALELGRVEGREHRAVLTRHQTDLARLTAAASIALVQGDGACGAADAAAVPGSRGQPSASAGPWAHVEQPTIPAWVGCDGTVDLIASGIGELVETAEAGTRSRSSRGLSVRVSPADARTVQLAVRALAWVEVPGGPATAVVVDVPVDGAIRARVLARTTVHLGTIAVAGNAHVVPGRATPAIDPPLEAGGLDLPLESVSFLDYRDWVTGERAAASASLHLRVGGLYSRIAASQGVFEGWHLGQILVYTLLVVGALFLLIQCVAVIMGFALARSITGSVHALFTGTSRVRQGDFSHRISVAARDQLGELAESFNAMTASVESLLREAGEKKRLEEELRIAHDIQMSLLPRAPVTLPGLSLSALCVPAREVGGDYYDVLPLGDERLGLLIADVAGKGTSAAFYMAELKGLMLSLSRTCDSPRALLIEANRLIARHLHAASFITMIYAVIDVRTGTMTYARAGHTPLLYAPGRVPGLPRRVQVLVPDGLVLGLDLDEGDMFDRLLEEQTVVMTAGDVYVFYTDGITEAMNASDDCFGEHRLARAIEAHADLASDELRDCLFREVEAFVAGAPQHDDMTMLLVKVGDLRRAGEGASAAAPLAEATRA